MNTLITARRIAVTGAVMFGIGVVLILVIDQPLYLGTQAIDVGLGWGVSVGFIVKYTAFGLGLVLIGVSPIAWMIETRIPAGLPEE